MVARRPEVIWTFSDETFLCFENVCVTLSRQKNGDAGDDDDMIIIITIIIIINNNNINNSLHLLKTVKFTSLWAFQFYSKCLVFLNVYPDNRRPLFSDLLLAGNIGGILEGDPWT